MSIVLFCAYCSTVHMASTPSIKDLETEALRLGWKSTRKGWLCPTHAVADEEASDAPARNTPDDGQSAGIVLCQDSIERRRLSQQNEINPKRRENEVTGPAVRRTRSEASCLECRELEEAHGESMDEYIRLIDQQSRWFRQGQRAAAADMDGWIRQAQQRLKAALTALLEHQSNHLNSSARRQPTLEPKVVNDAPLLAIVEQTVQEFDVALAEFQTAVAQAGELRNADGYHMVDQTFKRLQLAYVDLAGAQRRLRASLDQQKKIQPIDRPGPQTDPRS